MGVSEILREIKSLPPEQRWQIIERTRETLGPEIPDSFKQGMREIAQGEVIELDDAVTDRGLRDNTVRDEQQVFDSAFPQFV